MNEEIFIPITLFAATTLVLWIYFMNRHKERMALIEKGADASLFKTKMNKLSALKWGMFFIGIGLGILFGNILAANSQLEEPVAYFSMIFLSGGASLIIYYAIARKLNKKE